MAERATGVDALIDEVTVVLKAAEQDDLDSIYDHRASIISMYVQAMAEYHFEEQRLEWLNDILNAVEHNDIKGCKNLLEQADDMDTMFLGSQFAAVMAGCFHHDELMTVAQTVGLKALLETLQHQKDDNTTN